MVKMLMIVEVDANSEQEATDLIDIFREAVQPGLEYGITISRATMKDLAPFGKSSDGPNPAAIENL